MHVHGGSWTDDKLEVMRRYFAAYAQALKNQPSPRFPFVRWYIDAFAGTGERANSRQAVSNTSVSLFADDGTDISQAKDGSVRLALAIEPPFDRYVFIDKSPEHVAALERLKGDFPKRLIDIRDGDANRVLRDIATETDWRKTRAAIFIDPYGMQIVWQTLQALAVTKVDIALLFPTGPLNRMLARDGNIPEEWATRIDSHLGPCDWRQRSYKTSAAADLFSVMDPIVEKTVNTEGLRQFVLGRLKSIFVYVCDQQLEMKNSRGVVLYHLFIICTNKSEAAIKLANKLASSAVKLPRRTDRR